MSNPTASAQKAHTRSRPACNVSRINDRTKSPHNPHQNKTLPPKVWGGRVVPPLAVRAAPREASRRPRRTAGPRVPHSSRGFLRDGWAPRCRRPECSPKGATTDLPFSAPPTPPPGHAKPPAVRVAPLTRIGTRPKLITRDESDLPHRRLLLHVLLHAALSRRCLSALSEP